MESESIDAVKSIDDGYISNTETDDKNLNSNDSDKSNDSDDSDDNEDILIDYEENVSDDDLSDELEDETDNIDFNHESIGKQKNINISDKKVVYLTGSNRISKPILYKYELIRLIGTRLLQVLNGATPMIITKDNNLNVDPYDLVLDEISQKKTPIIIIRGLPNNIKEEWKLEELEQIYDIYDLDTNKKNILEYVNKLK